jgi:hypothetical protein
MDDENHFVVDVLHKIQDHHHLLLLLFEKDVLMMRENMFRIISAIENSFVECIYILHL